MNRRRRRLALLVFCLALALALLVLPMGSRGVLEKRLSAAFGRPVTIGEVRFHVLPLGVDLLELRVAGPTPELLPFLEIARLEVVPSVATLLGPRLALSRLRIQGLRLRIHAFPGQGDDIPRGGGGGGGGGEVRIRRLVIEDSEFVLDHERVPLQLDLPEFNGRLAARRAGVLAGRISFGPGQLRFGSAPPLAAGTDIQLVIEGSLITVEAAHVRTEKTDLAYAGQIRIAKDPIGTFTLKGPADLGELDSHIFRSGFAMQGAAHFDGTLGVEGPRLRIKGRLAGTAGVFDGVPVPRFAGEVGKDEFGTHIRGLEVETLGGSGSLDIEIPPAPSIARLSAKIQGADAEKLTAWIFKIGTPGVGSSASGQVSIRWPRGEIRKLSGEIALELASRQDGRTPLRGRFEWTAQDGVQRVGKGDFRTPAAWAQLEGRIGADDNADLALDADTTDLTLADDLVTRLRRALGAKDARPAGFGGAGVFHGRWLGTLQLPVFEGRFSGRDVQYLGVTWGRADWAGVVDTKEVRSHSLILRRPGGELWLDGRTETGFYGEDDAVDVRVKFTSWPAADFRTALGWNVDISGLLSGEATVAGQRSAPQGVAHVTSPAGGRYYGVPYTDLEVATKFVADVTEVTSGAVRLGGGPLTFHGTLSDDGVYDGVAEARDVELGEVLPPLAPDVRWGGKLSFKAALQGTLTRPRLEVHADSPRIFVADEGAGALSAELLGSGDGNVHVTAACRSPRVDVTLAGSVGAEAPYAAGLTIVSNETSLDPFLRALVPSIPALAGIVVSGGMKLSGPLLSPRDLHVDADVARLEVQLPDYPVRNPNPMRFSVEAGQLRMADFRLAGEGTNLAVAGSAALLRDGPLELSVRGEADLRVLSLVTRRLRGSGAARLAVDVAGTRGAPQVDGTLDLQGAGLRVRGFPHGLEEVRGSVRFSERAAHFEGATATLGGGAIEMEGQAAYREGKLVSFDVHGAGREMALHYPEGLRSTIDADLRFFGDAQRQWVAGSVEVRQALWTRRYDVATELLAAGKAWEEAGSLGEGLHYDVKVRAPGSLRIDNNLATLQARADLALQGSYDAPVVLGRAEIDRGRVYFQGNTYVIRRGSIDFANPRKIDPLFDIEAETRIRSYRVTLKVNGTLERVYPTLSSDPPLTSVQILNLLAGADERTVASLQTAQTDQSRLAATGAATLAAGKLSEEVGLERGAERLFGLNRFSIDPSAVKGGVTNPTARLTVGKRLTPDLNVLYSVDLRGTEERILSVEYTLSDRFSLLVTRSDTEGYGFDLRLQHSR